MPCAAIIVAGGSSRRMGFDKLAALLRGVPVLRRSVDAMIACEQVGRVIVACPAERFDALLQPPFDKPVLRVDPGAERQFSVAAGLAAVDEASPVVAVHDAARPLVDPAAVDECIAIARESGAAALARPVTETLKKADAGGFARSSVDRSRLWFMETPQVFRTELLRKAYQKVLDGGLVVTDEVSALEAIGVATRLVPSPGPNLKITHPPDLALAEALLRE